MGTWVGTHYYYNNGYQPPVRGCPTNDPRFPGNTRKELAIRRIAVRETGVFSHHGGQIEGPLKSLGPFQHNPIGEFKGGLQLGPHYAKRGLSIRQRLYLFYRLAMYIAECFRTYKNSGKITLQEIGFHFYQIVLMKFAFFSLQKLIDTA